MKLVFDHWLFQITISALLGFLLPYIIKALIMVIRRRQKTNICGIWNTYSFIMENNTPTVLLGRMKINKGILHLYNVSVEENDLMYKGYVTIENNHLLFSLRSNDGIRAETSSLRIDRSSYARRTTMYGYWLSYDSDNKLSSGVFVMSAIELDLETLEREVSYISVKYFNNNISRIEY